MEFKINTANFFYILPLGIIFNMILGWEYTPYYTPDSYGYIKIAQDLPIVETTVFPIFYPSVLRVFNFFFHNYDVDVKFLNIILIIFVFGFVKHKNFYWKEIWVMFTFSSLQSIYPMVWSENLLLSLIIFYTYVNFKFLNLNWVSKQFIFTNALLLFLMFATKYNAVFFLATNIIFILYLTLKKNNKQKAVSYLISTLFSLVFFGLYLGFNYFMTGFFIGKRGIPVSFNFMQYFFTSLKNVPLTYDPFSISIQRIAIHLKLLYGLKYITILPYFISYLITVILLLKFQKVKNKKFDSLTIFFILNSAVFLFFTFLSSYFTKIDIIDSRLLLNFYVFLIIAIIHFTRINQVILKEKKILFLGVLSLMLFLINLLYTNFI